MARLSENSVSGQMRALKVGESFSRTKRLALDGTGFDIGKEMHKLRNLMNQAATRLRTSEPGSNFRVESASAVTSDSAAILVTVAATRTEGDDGLEEMDI